MDPARKRRPHAELVGASARLAGMLKAAGMAAAGMLAACDDGAGAGGAGILRVDCANREAKNFWRLATGPDVERCAGRGMNALEDAVIMAIGQGNNEALAALIGLGVDLEAVSDAALSEGSVRGFPGVTPLIHAVRIGNDEMVEMLTEAGADVDVVYTERFTEPLRNTIIERWGPT